MLIRNNLYRSLIVFIVIGLLFAPIPVGNLWWREAVNSGHTVLFFFLTVVIHKSLKSRFQFSSVILRCTYVLLAGFMLGIVIEVLQVLVQREFSLNDLYRNFVGIVAGICLLAALDLKKSNNYKITIVFLIVGSVGCLSAGLAPLAQLSWHYIGRASAFPVIMNFDSEWSSSFVRHNKGRYPGVSIFEPEPDWSAYRRLRFSVYSANEADMSLGLRVHDENHNNESSDRFNMKLPIRSGVNEFKIPLDIIRDGPLDRELDLKSIAGIVLYSRKLEEWIQVDVSNFYLE